MRAFAEGDFSAGRGSWSSVQKAAARIIDDSCAAAGRLSANNPASGVVVRDRPGAVSRRAVPDES
jgi:hypothetical protein